MCVLLRCGSAKSPNNILFGPVDVNGTVCFIKQDLEPVLIYAKIFQDYIDTQFLDF